MGPHVEIFALSVNNVKYLPSCILEEGNIQINVMLIGKTNNIIISVQDLVFVHAAMWQVL